MLLGRESELRQLANSLERGTPVVVLGEAGIGKTAVVRAAAEAAGVKLREGGALSTLSWMPYFPLERAFGRKLRGGDPAYVAEEVDRVLGQGTLFLDDLHWADASTRAVLPLLGARTRVVTAVRREDAGTKDALDLGKALGAQVLALDPLEEPAAAALLDRLKPGLSAAAAQSVVRQAGGNPLLLEELSASAEASESLRLSIASRLRHLDPDARAALGTIALAGRPLPRRLVGPAEQALVEAGFARREGTRTAIRHALLADAAVSALSEEVRTGIHLLLARSLREPGEAARHYAAAGERERAHAAAMRAADRASTPGERADHLAVAAANASGPDADGLAIGAAQALIEAGQYSDAVSTLEHVGSVDTAIVAEAALLRWRALHALGDLEGAGRAWQTGFALAEAAPTEINVRVRVEQSAVTMELDRNPQLALVQARAAMRLASTRNLHTARARYLLGRAAFAAGAPGWRANLERALGEARAEHDHDLTQAAGGLLGFGLLISGRLRQARTVTELLVDEARELRLTGRERRLRARLAGIDWHAGHSREAANECEALLAERLDPGEAFTVRFYLAQALADQARYDRARDVLDELRALAPGDRGSLEHVLWAEADLELWSGRPRHALAAADRCLDAEALPSEGPHLFVRITRNWACLELGIDPGVPALEPVYGMGEAMPFEEQALAALAAGNHDDAARLFHDAARLWRGRHARGEVRSLFGRGEALRLAGDVEQARRALAEAERAAERRQCLALLARIRRSQRLCGEYRAAARTRGRGRLTGREQEVLELAAAGLSNAEIARRLGLGRSTVKRMIASASQKLNTRSRLQAAALASRE
jgi:DNA-binding CsgD family transcriptional regulator